MRYLSTLAVTFAFLACGGATTPAATTADPPARAPDDPSAPPAAIPGAPDDASAGADRSTPTAATMAYLDAALALQFEDMYALMTPECSNEERAWEKGLTRNLADGRIRLRTYEVGEPEVVHDTAKVAVQATLVADPAEPEGVEFDLRQESGGWAIVAIR